MEKIMQIDQGRIESAIVAEAVTHLVGEEEFLNRIRRAVDDRINKLFKAKADAQIDAAINDAIRNGFDREYCRVTAWGEKDGEPTTIRKELDKVIGNYWNVQVDSNGKSASGYGAKMTRAEWIMSKIVADDFSGQMKQHVANIAGGLKDNLRRSLHETVNELLSDVFKVKSIDDGTLNRTGDACIQHPAK
jgi:hypothetical protein